MCADSFQKLAEQKTYAACRGMDEDPVPFLDGVGFADEG